MRTPILRSPGAFAAVGFCLGIIGKLLIGSRFSVGWTMVVLLWVVPLVSAGIISEYLPEAREVESRGLKYFSLQRNRLELLASLALPGLGFAIDFGLSSVLTIASVGVGVVGVGASALLARIERTSVSPRHDL